MEHFPARKLTRPTPGKRYRRPLIEVDALRAYIMAFPPGDKSPWHGHRESHEIFYVVGGSGAILSDEAGEIAVEAGDGLRVAPGEFHAVRAGTEGLVILAAVAPNMPDTIAREFL